MPRVRRRKLWLWTCGCLLVICLFLIFKEPNEQFKTPWEWKRASTIPKNTQSAARTNRLETCSQKYPLEATVNEQTEEIWKQMHGGKSHNYAKQNQNKPQGDQKLKIFVVPHSHADPGWLKTYDAYTTETNDILNLMLEFMTEHPNMSFIWTEVSFFETWWKTLDDKKKEATKRLLKSGKLELCSGGWVMTDEANAYFPISIDNLIEGQQFLFKELGMVPQTMWSNDPFGYSATIPYLFKKSGLNDLVINRINHGMKQILNSRKSTPFQWRQFWDQTGQTDVLTHLLPYAHYDVPNSCGPSASICCQFDFKRLTHFGCGGPSPQKITPANVADRAKTLVEQYKAMANNFKAPVLLTMLGDDFRFKDMQEWHQQHDNYMPLFEYINAQQEFNIEIKFGTLSDYFGELKTFLPSLTPPTLSGDFFPYSDVGQVVWTGYFTTRPFYKRNERLLHHYLRAADLMSAWATAATKTRKAEPKLLQKLTESRRNLALFQHHDAITGTSRRHVVIDYGKRLFKSILDSADVLAQSLQSLLTSSAQYSAPLTVNELPFVYNASERKMPIVLEENTAANVFVFNSLPHIQTSPITLHVTSPRVRVTLANDQEPISAQINPVFVYEGGVKKDLYELVFFADLAPLSVNIFTLTGMQKQPSSTVFAEIGQAPSIGNDLISDVFKRIDINKIDPGSESQTDTQYFVLKTSQLETRHDVQNGLIKEVVSDVFGTQSVNLSFWHYKDTSSGAYIFNPHEAAKPWPLDTWVMYLVKGPLMSQIHSFLPRIYHTTTIYDLQGSAGQQIHISNVVDLRNLRNDELVLRMDTDVTDKTRRFYTDSNGLHLVKRQFQERAQFEANYYPMPTAVVLQDDEKRLTVLGDHPHGTTSHAVGGLEIMLDRILAQDDYKGLGFEPDGLPRDNVPAKSKFTIVFENRSTNSNPNEKSAQPEHFLYHSLAGHGALQSLLYPPIALHTGRSRDPVGVSSLSLIGSPFPCDYQLLWVRPSLPDPESRLMVVHRVGIDCQVGKVPNTCSGSEQSLVELLKSLRASSVQETDLSGVHTSSEPSRADRLSALVAPMELRGVRFKIQ